VFILFYSIFVSWCVVVFVFLSTSRDNGWEEHLQNELFCVMWDIKPY